VDIDANGDEVKYTEVSWLDLVAKEAARLRRVKRNSPTFLYQFIKQGSGLADTAGNLVWILVLWICITLMRIRMRICIRLITLMRMRIRFLIFLFDADPDSTFHPDVDPDPDPSF
jgi:hypothetical protein